MAFIQLKGIVTMAFLRIFGALLGALVSIVVCTFVFGMFGTFLGQQTGTEIGGGIGFLIGGGVGISMIDAQLLSTGYARTAHKSSPPSYRYKRNTKLTLLLTEEPTAKCSREQLGRHIMLSVPKELIHRQGKCSPSRATFPENPTDL
jgi:hypothetical protein